MRLFQIRTASGNEECRRSVAYNYEFALEVSDEYFRFRGGLVNLDLIGCPRYNDNGDTYGLGEEEDTEEDRGWSRVYVDDCKEIVDINED
jgi:hypothetical protein